ncbi:tetratricopeptide repeat protein [Sandaracinus amylolyticus]|uniref:tetratricopeptide repeat protein n=1 Tax=Sandaracinus amylolyticus TaxID=927083 RepID=UPI001F328DD3|nr:tetratricopeptide repeat protein [Sandaracinus amylolyticus]
MSARSEESAVERLRKQAERAIAAAQGRRVVEPLLERIVSLAPDGSDASVFAHRHLAEYRIEDHPWRALLHLRKVVGAHPDDDVVHALMGLSHALLANFRSAVSSYRRALALAPRNPWYHHNLGHLLDVALDQPATALRHLEFAHRAANPPEHEIAASLAHCLARLGRIDDARETATVAVQGEPRNREHKQLLAWIERGAPEEEGDPRTRRASPEQQQRARGASPARNASPGRSASTSSRPPREVDARREVESRSEARAERRTPRPTGERTRGGESRARTEPGVRVRGDDEDAVLPILERVMRDGGFTPEHVARARRLWVDYRETRGSREGRASRREERAPRAPKPDVCAAAIEYAIARLHGLDGVTRASVARRYGVSARAVSERFDDIQVVLALKPDDPRYARC